MRLARGARRPLPLRLWWALPGMAVAGTAVGLAVVVGPTLGEHVAIPRQLVLVTTPASAPPTALASPAHKPSHRPAPRSTSSSKAAATPTPASAQTHVVAPRRPVVRASSDDIHERGSGNDRSGSDTNGTDG